MAIHKVNGRRSRVAPAASSVDTGLVLAQAQQVTSAAGAIARISDQMAAGADEQTRALDRSLVSLNEVGSSLKDTAHQAESIAVSAEELDQAVTKAITDTGASGAKDIGKVMKAVMAALAGKTVDGKKVNELVRTKLT